jgi:hypothetical protein
MTSVYGTISRWASKATTSFAELRAVPSHPDEAESAGDALIYRLKQWPELPAQVRTAGVLRTLSMMSHRPVNRRWIAAHSKLQARDVDRFLARLIAQDALHVIDSSLFAARTSVAAALPH